MATSYIDSNDPRDDNETGNVTHTGLNDTQEAEISLLDTEKKVDFYYEFLVPGVLLNGVGLLGLVGNLLSIFILSRPQMKGSTNCILIGLATYDSILIISR